MTMHPPKGYVVLWMAKFRDNDCKSPNAQEKFGSFDLPCVAYSSCLTHIERYGWELMCSMEACGHIYVDDWEGIFNYNILVLKGPWKVDL